jgi:cytochrome c oxidase subunit 2
VLAIGDVQIAVGLVFLGLATGAVVVLVLVARHARVPALPYPQVQRPGYRLRRVWLGVVLLAVVASVGASLFFLPYPTSAATQQATPVQVIGQQYAWQISTTTFRQGQTVDFAVTSRDVNHGFGLYSPDGKLIAQVQAMPEYVNHLVVTFREPGRYTVRCLEYCGLAHDVMQSALVVAP